MRLNTSLIDKVILNKKEQVEFSYSQPSPPYSTAGFNQVRRMTIQNGEANRTTSRKNMSTRENASETNARHQITQQRIRSRMIIKK